MTGEYHFVRNHLSRAVRTLLNRSFRILTAAFESRSFEILYFSGGEENKRISHVEQMAEQMVERGGDRSSLVVAFGGGITTDLAGFLAAIFMRGIPVIQVPTTLLAQVDAAIGGKTAVNLPQGMHTLVGHNAAQLSGGQRQRVMLAIALAALVFTQSKTAWVSTLIGVSFVRFESLRARFKTSTPGNFSLFMVRVMCVVVSIQKHTQRACPLHRRPSPHPQCTPAPGSKRSNDALEVLLVMQHKAAYIL